MKNILLILVFLSNFLFANIEDNFPTLEGRIVDEVNLLSNETKANLNQILATHEKETSNQIVLVILKTLNGYEIADYSYQLGRYWGIGQKDKNNGVLLVIALKERKIRIEVGYGLEGALTDKISHDIIEYTIKPNFKRKNFEKGVIEAINEIIKAIKGEYKAEEQTMALDSETEPLIFFIIIFISIILSSFFGKSKNLFLYKIFKSSLFSSFFSIFIYSIASAFTSYYFIIAIIVFIILFIFNFINIKKIDSAEGKGDLTDYISSSYGSGFGSSFGGGGFSGGGGSFGGGGASGGW